VLAGVVLAVEAALTWVAVLRVETVAAVGTVSGRPQPAKSEKSMRLALRETMDLCISDFYLPNKVLNAYVLSIAQDLKNLTLKS
jgi:hypothetical protein